MLTYHLCSESPGWLPFHFAGGEPELDVNLFELRRNDFSSGADFRTFMRDNVRSVDVEHELTILVGQTDLDGPGFRSLLLEQGFQITSEMGCVLRVKKTEADLGTVEAYVTFEGESGLFLFYTNYRKTEEVRVIKQRFLRRTPRVYHMFLRPLVMRKIVDVLVGQNDNLRIPSFTAKRRADSRYRSATRAHIERTIRYWGADGRETLDELDYVYGVLPTKIEFSIPNVCSMTVDAWGQFTLHEGSLEPLFEAMSIGLEEAQRNRLAFERASFKVVEPRISQGQVRTAWGTPLTIDLVDPMAFAYVDSLRAALTESGFALIGVGRQEGSLLLRGNVVDSTSGATFELEATEDRIRLFPDREKSFESFMRFYETVVHEVDPKAAAIG